MIVEEHSKSQNLSCKQQFIFQVTMLPKLDLTKLRCRKIGYAEANCVDVFFINKRLDRKKNNMGSLSKKGHWGYS